MIGAKHILVTAECSFTAHVGRCLPVMKIVFVAEPLIEHLQSYRVSMGQFCSDVTYVIRWSLALAAKEMMQ